MKTKCEENSLEKSPCCWFLASHSQIMTGAPLPNTCTQSKLHIMRLRPLANSSVRLFRNGSLPRTGYGRCRAKVVIPDRICFQCVGSAHWTGSADPVDSSTIPTKQAWKLKCFSEKVKDECRYITVQFVACSRKRYIQCSYVVSELIIHQLENLLPNYRIIATV